jgi:anti-sigma factor RsiW
MSPTTEGLPCPEEILALLSAYLDGETTPPETARVEEHLQDCPSCQDELAFLSETAGALAGLAKSDPAAAPPDFVASVQGAIRHRSRDRFYSGDLGAAAGARSTTPTSQGSSGGLRATYNAIAVSMLLILAAAAVSLLPPARVPSPRISLAPSAVGLPANAPRSFRVAAAGLTEEQIRPAAVRVGATDIQRTAGGRALDIRMPRGDADKLLNVLRALGPVEIERLAAPAADARGDRVQVRF